MISVIAAYTSKKVPDAEMDAYRVANNIPDEDAGSIDEFRSFLSAQKPRGQSKSAQFLRKVDTAQRLAEKISQRKFRPTLILGPSQGFGVWKGEMKSYFPSLKLRQFYSARSRSSLIDRDKILGTSIIDLLRYIADLPDDPSALLVR